MSWLSLNGRAIQNVTWLIYFKNFQIYFSPFSFSVTIFSHLDRKTYFSEELEPFLDNVGLMVIFDFAGIAGGERMPPAPLGWHFYIDNIMYELHLEVLHSA